MKEELGEVGWGVGGGAALQLWHQQAVIKSSRVCRSKLGEEVLKRMQSQTKLQPRENYCGGHETVT